jgi:hypothetical protein
MSRYTAEYWDHRRDELKHEWRPGDPMPLDQRCALAKLIGYSEAIAAAGLIGDSMETKLRACIAETLVAFQMQPRGERSDVR